MFLHFKRKYRTAVECDFLDQVEDELAKFNSNCKPNSVLVFPPLNAHYRFLIHQFAEVDSRLQTVSIGEGRQRRTVVYFATSRAVREMAQSPSTSQRTFFGRGRGRRTRRPDQPLYAPGALRQAKRQEQQEQKLSKERAIEREPNETLSTENAANVDALPRFTAKDFRKCHLSEKFYDQKCDSQPHDDGSKKMVNVKQGTGQTSCDIQDQHENVNCTLIQGTSSDCRRAGKEIIARGDSETDGKELTNEVVTTIIEDSSMTSCENAPSSVYIREKNESCSSDGQIFHRESSDIDFDDIKDKVGISGTGNIQLSLMCIARNDRAAETSSMAVNENCRTSNKTSCEDQHVTVQNQCERTSSGNRTRESNEKQSHPFIEEKKDLFVNEKVDSPFKKSKVTEDGKAISGHFSEITASVGGDHDGVADVRNDKNCMEMKSITNSESSDVFIRCGSDTVDCRGEQIQSKIISSESVQQSAFSSVSQDCRESNSGSEGLTLLEQMLSVAQTSKVIETSGGIRLGEDDSPSDQHRTVVNSCCQENVSGKGDISCEERSDLTESYLLKSCTEEVIIIDEVEVESPKAEYSSAGHDTVSSAKDKTAVSGNADTTSSVQISGKLEIQSICNFGVINSDKMSDKSVEKLETVNENIEATSAKMEANSDSTALEVSQDSDELQKERTKSKKSRKVQSKDSTDEKAKGKEKGAKKKKEKKRERNEKDGNDTKKTVIKGRKSKAKVLSNEKQDEKERKCDRDDRKELNASTKVADSCHSNSNDDDGVDSDDWESFFDESGDCLNPEHLEELSRLTGIVNPEVQKTQFDFYSFTPKEVELDDEEFGHIVEIYNFSPDLMTQDLMQALSMFRNQGFDIKWVDDTHALGVFSSRISAQEAIKLCSSPLMKLRPVSQGTPESQKKATNCFEFLQPFKERPQTSKLLADRLVTGALGVRSKMTREDRVKEREKIREAKNKKQQEKIQKAQIWGD